METKLCYSQYRPGLQAAETEEMMETKLCPLLKTKTEVMEMSRKVETVEAQPCIGPSCAWWKADTGCCGIRDIADNLDTIVLQR